MQIVVYSQYYRTRTPERQLEIDECLRRNLNHPGISRMVLFCESDAPPVPEGTVPVEVISSDERITYAEWFRWVQRQGSGIGLLLNADIYLDEGLGHLAATFDSPETFLALTRYNPGHAGFHLNDYPHWTQDVWGVRADAELPESLLYASSFPLGFPGCDNRIAYVMWSHGFRVRNPCYHVRSVHLQASTARAYDKTSDRLYGGVSYVHPSLAPDEDAELEFTLWTRSEQRPAGVLINQQAIEQGVHQLRHGEPEVAQRFLDLQQFTGLSWVHEAVGSAHLQGDLHPFASEDTVFLPLPALLEQGVELQLPRPTKLEGLTLRLPRRAPVGYQLELEAQGEAETQLLLQCEAGLALKGGGQRRFWQPAELKGRPWNWLRLKLSGADVDPAWRNEEGAELVLFGEQGALEQVKNISVEEPDQITLQPPESVLEAPAVKLTEPVYQLSNRHACEAQLERAETLHCFGSRFEVLSDGVALYFVDRFWPVVGKVMLQNSGQALLSQGEEALFAVGFLQPVQEWKPDQIASEKTYRDQQLFWQYPCRTEEDAYRVHRGLEGPQRDGDAYQVYVGLPWATFIDRGVNQQLSGSPYPEALLLAHRKRAEALASVLRHWGRTLQVHSVCQHIFWRQAASWIRSAGITDLWISHKEQGLDEEQGLRLHSWSLYAVNDRDPARRQGLAYVPIEQRPVFASFSGAHMKHYISDVRQRMAALAELEGYLVTITDMWHFNKVVYNFQVFGDESKKDAIGTDEVRSYNELLSHTRFSLCPAGAGPNTLRLWESLAVGAIPVVLSDRHQLPDLSRLLPGEALSWEQVVVLHPEAELDTLDACLRAIDPGERHRRQLLCRRVYEASVALTCFGRSSRPVEPIPLLQELFKPQQVQIPGQTTAEFTGVARQVPATLALAATGISSIVVHLDQTEQLLGFQLKGIGCTLDQVSVTLSRYREYNKFDELPLETEATTADQAWLCLPRGERWWAMGLKLTAEWKPGAEARPEANLQLAVLSEKDAFAREARRLDRAGILKAASDRNAERQDDTFDTKHINSGAILERLPAVARPEDVVPGNELFPPLPPPQMNLIGELLGDGVTMYVHLMNRNENVQKNLGNWLQQRFDELILLDWSSTYPVAEIPGVFDDPRVRVVRVDGQTKFIRTLAQNLASRMARNRRIFKCDSDVEFKGDFFGAHPLEPGEFWVGEWHHARDENEKHLHGETYYHIADFERVNGYDERIISYGQDDTNLKDRMVLSGATKHVFNFDFIHHQEHGDLSRTTNQTMLHPMVRTFAHRLFVNSECIYSRNTPQESYVSHNISAGLVEFTCIDFSTTKVDHGSLYEEKALDIVASWYTNEDVALLSKEVKLDLVWQNSGIDNNSKSYVVHSVTQTTEASKASSEFTAKPMHDISDIESLVKCYSNSNVIFKRKQRILILGSSISVQKNGYLPRLKSLLNAFCSDDHEYLNASLGGTPSEATYCYVHSNLVYDIASFNPSICLIEKTPNDKIYDFCDISKELQATKIDRIKKYLLSLVEFMKNRKCAVALISMYIKPDNCLSWEKGNPLNYLSSIYDHIATETETLHINVAEKFIKRFSGNDLSEMLLDDVHLTDKGAAVVGQLILEDLAFLRQNETTDVSRHLEYISPKGTQWQKTTLMTLLQGNEARFHNALLDVDYNVVKVGEQINISTKAPGFLIGIFYLNDAQSGWIRITTDRNHCLELQLFDHFSYMPRLHYRSLPEIDFGDLVSIEVIDKTIDYKVTLQSYENAKTFDPTEPWAVAKYLDPLLHAINTPGEICFKPVLLMGGIK